MSEPVQVWVEPHMRAGRHVEGHWRNLNTLTKAPGPAAAVPVSSFQIAGPPPVAPDTRLLGLNEDDLGPLRYPPLGTKDPATISTTWLTRATAADPDVVAQIQRVYASQRDLTTAQELGLAYSPSTNTAPVLTGSNTINVVTLNSGQIGFHKPYTGLDDDVAYEYGHHSPQQPVHEIAAWRIAKHLGPPWDDMVPPTVMRDVEGQVGSISLEMPGNFLPRTVYTDHDPATAIDKETWRAAGFFDAVIGQQDRHARNALYRDDGSLSLIDHGFAFGNPGDFCNRSAFQSVRVLCLS